VAHVLAKLRGMKAEVIKEILTKDASQHAREGLYLEHLWQNADDPDEVQFLFRTDDLNHAKQFINNVHTQALKENPNANLPHMTFLEDC
jgi:hypothetical protein